MMGCESGTVVLLYKTLNNEALSFVFPVVQEIKCTIVESTIKPPAAHLSQIRCIEGLKIVPVFNLFVVNTCRCIAISIFKTSPQPLSKGEGTGIGLISI